LRRAPEIGLRLALGAVPAQVIRMIVRESLVLVGLGIALGAVAAFSSARLIAAMMFETSPTDPVTYAAVAILLLVTGAAAALVPARRASRIEPLTALRLE
jgi:ABC-type antimicrobial peptide transport system permease subunit